jgi:SAM-dependent methyltransferase
VSAAASPGAAVDPAWLEDVLACPRCKGAVTRAGDRWTCAADGVVGELRLGFPDFLARDRDLPMANSDELDLESDDAFAAELHARFDDLDHAGLRDVARARGAERTGLSGERLVRLREYHARLAANNAQADDRHAPVLLAKVEGRIAELGWPTLPTGIALEAGGGEGWYALGFAERFDRVVFVDASLANIVLAAKMAQERGLDNVAFVRADVMALPFRDGTCDLVHQNGVIEHVSDPDGMVSESVRVRSPDGYYVCVSPNRLSLMPEPHFGIPGFGFVPERMRKPLIARLRGFEDEHGTDLRTLWALRRHFKRAGEKCVEVFFLPRRLPATARQTTVRRLVRGALDMPVLGGALSFVLNRVLLPVVPQHIVLARRSD